MTLNPWYITGLIDAESCFTTIISKDSTRRCGYNITYSLELALNYTNKLLLEKIKYTLGVGNIYYRPRDKTYIWKVSSIKDLVNVIIPHLTNYPLLTKKKQDFELFKEIVFTANDKELMSKEKMLKLIKLKSSLNLGLNDKLKTIFPNTTYSVKNNTFGATKINPYWLAGFVDGEGCFFVSLYKSSKSSLGYAVQLSFIITQHIRDELLLHNIANYLGCGRVVKRNEKVCDFKVNKFDDIIFKVIPFFLNYPLCGSKLLDYNDFNKVVNIMAKKEHLTETGLEKIITIKSNMNTGRKI